MLLENLSSAEQAQAVVERINSVLGKPMAVGGRAIPLHASIGVAVSDKGAAQSEDMLRIADQAMYRQKKSRHRSKA